jgi:putative ABC transport system substrate-binding protein
MRIGRRDFITLLGGAAAAWPLAARAQQPAMPVIGVLGTERASDSDLFGLRRGLRDAGFVEGQNLAIEFRWADSDPDRVPELAANLVRLPVRAIVAFRSSLPIAAARALTSTIPIVFGIGSDPVALGYVASLNRPGGNITGMTSLAGDIVGKQFGLLHEKFCAGERGQGGAGRRPGGRPHDRAGTRQDQP